MKKYSILFFLIMFLIGTDSFLISPLLPILARNFNVSAANSAWMTATYAIGFALFALVAGPLSDSRDRKNVMLVGLIGFGLATLLCGLASNFTLMLIFRFLAGVSASFITPQVWASVPRVTRDNSSRMKLMGVVMAGLAGAQVLGVPIGSFLALHSWHMSFFVVAASTLLLIFALWRLLPGLPPVLGSEKQKVSKIYAKLLKNRSGMGFVTGFGVIFVGSIAVMSFLGTWFNQDFHLDLAQVGTALLFVGLGQFLGGLFGSHITQHFGNQRWLRIAFISWALLYLILPFMPNLPLAVVVLALIFGINGMTIPVLVLTNQNTAPEVRGTMSALSNFSMYTGQAVGGAFAGVFYSHFPGYFGISYFALVIFLSAALIYWRSGFWKVYKS